MLCFLILISIFSTLELNAQISPDDLQRIESAVPLQATASPKESRKLLVFTRTEGFVHKSIPHGAKAMEILGKRTGAFEATVSDDMAIFDAETLNQFDAVCFVSTTELAFENPAHRNNLMAFVKGGKGIIGIHAATDNFYTWHEAAKMIGGQFDGHPWTSNGDWAVMVDDPDHPLTAAFSNTEFRVNDEIYRIKPRNIRETCRVLVSLDMRDAGNLKANGVQFTDKDIPISWVRKFGDGRVFYSSFGHNNHIFWHPEILKHYLDGIQFALGDLEADTTPIPFNAADYLDLSELDDLLEQTTGYQYGDSRAALVTIGEFSRFASDSPALLSQIEQRMIAFLQSDASLAAKQFICEELSIIGTAAAVPVLATMLPAQETSNMARFALERIPGKESTEVLRKAMKTTDGAIKIGIVNSLGQRRDAGSEKELSKLIYDEENKALAAAAVAALGTIGNDKSAKALKKARGKTWADFRSTISDAYLRCAENLAEEGETKKARKIYEELFALGEPEMIRFAALQGLVATSPEKSAQLLTDVLNSGDTIMQSSAAALAGGIPASENIDPILSALPQLSPDAQVQLLTALAKRSDAATRTAMTNSLKSESQEVRLAALKSLATVGDAGTVLLLAETAASSKGAEREAARGSLYRLNSANTNQAILAGIPVSEPKVAIELIKSCVARQIAGSSETLLSAAANEDAKVRTEAIKALRVVAGPDDISAMLALLPSAQKDSERKEWEKTISAVANKRALAKGRAVEVLAALQSNPDTPTQASLLQIAGNTGDPEALPPLKAALNNANPDIQIAAIRALSDWPNDAPRDDLLAIAKDSGDQKQQTLALRGFVRLISLESSREDAETMALYQTASSLAKNDAERKMVLSGLGDVKTAAAIELAGSYLQDSTLQQEAAVAIVSIAEETRNSAPEITEDYLQRLLEVSNNDALKKEAEAHIAHIERFEGFITTWEVSGPYTQGDDDIFAIEFAPEKPESGDIDWQPMPVIDSERPWLINLEQHLGGDNRVAYLRTRVHVDTEQTARAELGSDDGVKMWVNGALVHAQMTTRGVNPGDDVVEISLKEGWNEVLLKVVNGGGGWGACLRLRNPEGREIAGMKSSLTEQM